MFPVPTFETQDTFDLMKVFPTFEAGLKELGLVSYSAANSVRAYVDDYQKEKSSWATEVRSAFAAAAEQRKWQSLLDQYGEDDSPLPAFVQEKTLVYTTTGGFTYGWRERADGTWEFGVKHPNSAERGSCPNTSSLRYQAWLYGWAEITTGGYAKPVPTPIAAIKEMARLEKEHRHPQPDKHQFIADWTKAEDKAAYQQLWQQRWPAWSLTEFMAQIVTEDPQAFVRGYFLTIGQQGIYSFLREALVGSPIELTDQIFQELIENRWETSHELRLVKKSGYATEEEAPLDYFLSLTEDKKNLYRFLQSSLWGGDIQPTHQILWELMELDHIPWAQSHKLELVKVEEEDDSAYLGKSSLRKIREGALLLDEDDE